MPAILFSRHRRSTYGAMMFITALAWVVMTAVGFGQFGDGIGDASELDLNSKAAILMDAQSGRIVMEYRADEPLPPASVTKIMTMVLALEAMHAGQVSPDDLVPTSPYAASMGGTQIWLEPGEEMPFGEMLLAVAVGSANDAAVALAEFLGGSEPAFVDMMNERAKALGTTNTHFANPSGLPPANVGKEGPHVSSARDLAILSRHALSLPGFSQLASTWGPVVMRPETQQKPVLWSFNGMLKTYPGMDGIKTGMTNEAGFCLAATAERQGLRLIAVTLGAPTRAERDDDIRRLLDEGFRRLKAVPVVEGGAHVTDVPVAKGRNQLVPLAAVEDFYVTVEKDATAVPEMALTLHAPLVAPLEAGDVVGELVVTLQGEEMGRTAVAAMESVDRASFVHMTRRYFHKMISFGREESATTP